MDSDFKPSWFDKTLGVIAPQSAIKRLAARAVLHQFAYDGARTSHKRQQAPQNINPNDFQKQRDRLQLLREAEDLENNFAPAKTLNRKYAMYVAPVSYHAATGDTKLDTDVEEWLNNEWFPNADITGRYDFFKMLEFGVMGMNRGGDYGWAYMRPGAEAGMSEQEILSFPLRIQAVESDRLGGVYQNVVSQDYVGGVIIGRYGEPTAYRVFRRAVTVGQYTDPVDVPAAQFVHYTDPMRLDMYRGVSKLDTAVAHARDLYEMIDFLKGKAKLASALTVFTNSLGAMQGIGSMDAYQTNLTPQSQGALQQDIQFGQINHLTNGQEIKFPETASPGAEAQFLMQFLMKLISMSYNLPYSFALDANELGGVSSRLESEQAKAEFERGQRVLTPHANRMKNAALMDAVAKNIFPMSVRDKITRGRWGFRPHPQPDIGKETSATRDLWQNGLLDPMKYWIDASQDPEHVAMSFARWYDVKKKAASSVGATVEEVFGNGPAMPTSISRSTTVDATPGADKADSSKPQPVDSKAAKDMPAE